jgi:hypothetical protein
MDQYNLKLSTFLTCLTLLVTSPLKASFECSAEEQASLELSRQYKAVECLSYKQPNDSTQYFVILDIIKDQYNEDQSRISHFVQTPEDNSPRLVFQKDKIGTHFLDLYHQSKRLKIVLFDINGDGKLDIIFRVYSTPTGLIYVQSLHSKGSSFSEYGTHSTFMGQDEFSPYIVSSIDSQVHLSPGKITLKSSNGPDLEYHFSGSHFRAVSSK